MAHQLEILKSLFFEEISPNNPKIMELPFPISFPSFPYHSQRGVVWGGGSHPAARFLWAASQSSKVAESERVLPSHPTPTPKKTRTTFFGVFFWMGGGTFCPNFCYHFFFHTQITDHKGRGSFPWWFPELGTATYGRNMLEKVMELIQRFDVWGPGGVSERGSRGIQQVFWHLSGCQCFVLYGGGHKRLEI